MSKTVFSNRERFIGIKRGDAPMTIGAPQYTNAANLKEFEKDLDAKVQAKNIKSAHKKALMQAYPEGIGRHLNVPKRELKETLKWEF